MKKMNILGIGPKIGMVAIPYFIVVLLLSIYFHSLFTFTEEIRIFLWYAGIIMICIGLVFYTVTVVMLIQAGKKIHLMTRGTYYLCQNPLYASIMLMLLPGLSFAMNSWLILTTVLVAYIRFKMNIHVEYNEMEELFGESYLEYKKKTPELIPFPFKKLLF